jgi:hypothetical protein
MLHVTNGDVVVGMLAASGLPGDRLAWADVLHEGPVRAGLSDEELRIERASFLTAGGRPENEVLAQLEGRDARLAEAAGREEIVLWFEADLYDQLQLLQILDRLVPVGVELICIGDHPSHERFSGLGELDSHDLPPLFEARETVTGTQVEHSRRAWAAFREPTPEALARLREGDLSALPFLAAALTRLLEDLPWTTDGLSRTERSLLAPLAERPAGSADLFRAHMAAEERPFLGDVWALRHLDQLCAKPRLARRHGDAFDLTDDGRAVLAGDLDAVELHDLDRWLGGTHLRSPDNVWRWDPAERSVRQG